jgi:hypothetical protein
MVVGQSARYRGREEEMHGDFEQAHGISLHVGGLAILWRLVGVTTSGTWPDVVVRCAAKAPFLRALRCSYQCLRDTRCWTKPKYSSYTSTASWRIRTKPTRLLELTFIGSDIISDI